MSRHPRGTVIPLASRETLAFLERSLPPAPARLLQVGAGDGEVARELTHRGYEVTALDETPRPREFEGAWIEAEFLHVEPDTPFDCLLFTDSLRSLQPIARALDRAVEQLAPRGLLLVEDLAFDRVNVHTARWLYDLESVLVAADVITPPAPETSAERRPLARWRLEHAFDPPLASGHDLLAAARERFELTAVEEAPYLYRELAARSHPDADDPRAARVLDAVFQLEQRLVRERDIAAAGLRFAGKRLL